MRAQETASRAVEPDTLAVDTRSPAEVRAMLWLAAVDSTAAVWAVVASTAAADSAVVDMAVVVDTGKI
jgi:hypothetical protein